MFRCRHCAISIYFVFVAKTPLESHYKINEEGTMNRIPLELCACCNIPLERVWVLNAHSTARILLQKTNIRNRRRSESEDGGKRHVVGI